VISLILFGALIVSLWGNWVLFVQREEAMKDLADQRWATERARNNK